MPDLNIYGVAENGTYSTGSPNPHIDLAGTSPTGFLIAQLVGSALTNGQTATVTIAKSGTSSVWAVYSGATYTTGTPNIIDLTAATLKESSGSLANSDSVVVLGLAPDAGNVADGSITLAKMANLAQDQAIMRVTASTGVPETATITAAARTVLDDTTVAAMVETLGGAASTGTGGLVRATSPTLVTPLLGTPTSGTLTNCGGLPESGLATTDVTTGDASTTKHGLLLKATAPASGLLNFVGIGNGETVYANKALFDTTNPAALGSVGPGTAVIAARRDHVHTLPKLDDLAAADDNTDLNVSTSGHGLAPKAVAPSSGQLNAYGIANGETAIANKTIFDGLLQVRVMTEAAYQALGPGRPSTTIYIRT